MLMLSRPGCQVDGTRASNSFYHQTIWTRFYQDLPRKILGYREQRRDLDGISRALEVESYDGYSYVHVGLQNVLQRYTINLQTGLTSGLIDRTPSPFDTSPLNNWQFSVVYDTANNANLLLAHAAPNIMDISSTVERPVYYSEVRDPAPLLEISGSDVSGGIVAMWPYFIRYGNDGEVAWPAPGDITDLSGTGSGSARPWGTKIVRGLPLRGTSGPAVLLWALDALVRMQFVGGTAIFDFSTLTTSSAILSSNGVIEHEGVYYWATVSGWALFNGVIRELSNEFNRQFFLDNLNWNQRQKVFAFKIPRWNEIWWAFPRGNSTECNWAVIYNYAKGFWFDTPLPVGFSSGVYEQIFHYPIVTSWNVNEDTTGTSSWQFDYGLDEVSGLDSSAKAILAKYRTHEFSTAVPKQPGQTGDSRTMSYSYIEPDFNQRGDLKISLYGRANARARMRSTSINIPAVPTGSEQVGKVKFTARLTSAEVESNEVGGYFEAGAPMIHWQPGDGRIEDGGDQPTEVDVADV